MWNILCEVSINIYYYNPLFIINGFKDFFKIHINYDFTFFRIHYQELYFIDVLLTTTFNRKR
jgi:hypothetical protein